LWIFACVYCELWSYHGSFVFIRIPCFIILRSPMCRVDLIPRLRLSKLLTLLWGPVFLLVRCHWLLLLGLCRFLYQLLILLFDSILDFFVFLNNHIDFIFWTEFVLVIWWVVFFIPCVIVHFFPDIHFNCFKLFLVNKVYKWVQFLLMENCGEILGKPVHTLFSFVKWVFENSRFVFPMLFHVF